MNIDIDTEALVDSALLVVVGMVVVFAGLFILMVAATITVRLAQPKNNTERRIETPPETAASSAIGEAGKGAIAAVAVALALSMQKGEIATSRGVIGGGPPSGAAAGSTWAAAGREQLMRSRGKVGHKWGRRSE